MVHHVISKGGGDISVSIFSPLTTNESTLKDSFAFAKNILRVIVLTLWLV